jgi:zinc transporter
MRPAYGSDQHGLICGYVFSGVDGGRDIGLDDALHWLSADRDGAEGGFLWLHFNLADVSAERWIETHLRPPPEFFEGLRDGSRSTRIEQAGNSLTAVVNDVAYEFSFDPSEIKTLWLAVDQRVTVSARVHPLRSIACVRRSGKGTASARPCRY